MLIIKPVLREWLNVRYGPKLTERLHCRKMTLWVTCAQRHGKNFVTFCSIGRMNFISSAPCICPKLKRAGARPGRKRRKQMASGPALPDLAGERRQVVLAGGSAIYGGVMRCG